MQRGGRLRRTESHPGPLRGQTYGRRRRRRLNDLEPPDTSTTSRTPLRRSARLSQPATTTNTPTNPTPESLMLRARATEAETERSHQRYRTRGRRETEDDTSPERHSTVTEDREQRPPTPTSPSNRRRIRIPRLPRSNNERMGPIQQQPDSDRTYSLQLAIRASRVVQAGAPIYPPLVTILSIRDGQGGPEITGDDELSYMFVQAALYDEAGSLWPIAPPDSAILSGRLALSPELINDTLEDDAGTAPSSSSAASAWAASRASFAMFSDLKINRPGTYRIGFTLLKIGGNQTRSSAGGRRRRNEGGMSLAEVRSDVIRVQHDPVVDLPVSMYYHVFPVIAASRKSHRCMGLTTVTRNFRSPYPRSSRPSQSQGRLHPFTGGLGPAKLSGFASA